MKTASSLSRSSDLRRFWDLGHWALIGHWCLVIGAFFLAGCEKSPQSVVLYTSVDQPTAARIVDNFVRQTGLQVELVTDTEATKSVGLAERLRAEKSSPRAHVWWGNEPFHTIQLAEEKLLLAYESPATKEIKDRYKDPEHRWAGCGLRARVLIVNDEVSEKGWSDLEHLQDEMLKGKIAMARPSAGTTGGHVAALYVLMGEEKANELFRGLHANGIKLLGGNGPVAQAVASGTISVGLTDNDDVANVLANGAKVTMVYPGAGGQRGTLAVPTTVGLVQDSPEARKLVDYLLSSGTEDQLLEAKFTVGSVRRDPPFPVMDVDLRETARVLRESVRKATAILEGR